MSESHDNAGITITPAATGHIRNQLNLTGCRYLRLGLKESGCNGYMYMLDFLEAPEADDLQFSFSTDVEICVHEHDLPMVQGTQIDMLTEGLNTALIFKNPNATSYCGCGESFAVGGEPDGFDVDPGDLATDVGSKQ